MDYFCRNMITHEIALEQFHRQIRYTLETYQPHGLNIHNFKNIIIGGLGGSGIGGRIARSLFLDKSPVPVEVFSEYTLPNYADKHSLVILSSYSGNTEETLSMYEDALSRQCTVICIASGGKLQEIAKQSGLKLYAVETGYQPRMALGYSLSTLLMIFGELNGLDMKTELESVCTELEQNNTGIRTAEEMKTAFRDSAGDTFVVVSDVYYEATAIRFCQQIQENAKGEAFVTVLPEANHNVIESYYEKRSSNFIFLDSGRNARTTARFGFLKGILNEKGNRVFQMNTDGFGVQQVFRCIHAMDWLSIFISNEKGADNMQVAIITRLKEFLDKTH